MSATFHAFYPLLSEMEGAFQKIASDPGNYNSLGQLVGTKYGISAKFYEQNVLGYAPTEQDMRNITKGEAKSIYKDFFWNVNKAYKINDQAVANTIIDMQVNSGRGVRIAQEVLRDEFGATKPNGEPISVDGIAGNNTINAINSVNPAQFVKKYNSARKDYYKNIGNDEWIDIWLNRVKRFAYTSQTTISIVGILFLAGLGYSVIKLA